MKYELTREQISHIFHLGQVWAKDSVSGAGKVDFYLNNLLKEQKDITLRGTNNPNIGEEFLFRSLKFKCLSPELESNEEDDLCTGCFFLPICNDDFSRADDSPKCVSPHRIFKLIKEDE